MRIPEEAKALIKDESGVYLKYAGKRDEYDVYAVAYHWLPEGGYPCVGYPRAIFSNEKETRWATAEEAMAFFGFPLFPTE